MQVFDCCSCRYGYVDGNVIYQKLDFCLLKGGRNSSRVKKVSHMSLFTNRNIQTSLIDVLNDHGFYMKRDGTENEESVVANKRKGMYLCEMKFINGLRHVVRIDYDYMIIWDPTCQTALPLLKEFFKLNVNFSQERGFLHTQHTSKTKFL